MKVWQEIHCTKSGGGCGGFFLVKLNTALNKRAELVCPKCGHRHTRNIINGRVHERGRFDSSIGPVSEEICPTMAAWSSTPRTKELEKYAGKDGKKERNGAVINSKDDIKTEGEEILQVFLHHSWIEKFAGRMFGRE